MRKCVCPGTFDPITNGHIDIIKRATIIFDEIIVAVAQYPSKETLFSYTERLALVKEALKDIKNVKVEGFSGLVVDFASRAGAKVIVRGVRMISDFEYEFQMALTNRNLASHIETIFLMPHPDYAYISSRLIKEAADLGADLGRFLPKAVSAALKGKVNENKSRRNS